MLERKIVGMIEAQAAGLTAGIYQALLRHSSTQAYGRIESTTVQDWIYDVCSRFSYWLEQDREPGKVDHHFRSLARTRFQQGFTLPEVLSALSMTKRKLWEFIADNRDAASALDLNQILETSFLLVRFFDHAMLGVIRGFEEIYADTYGITAALLNPEILQQTVEAKQRRSPAGAAKARLPDLCFTKGMIRLP